MTDPLGDDPWTLDPSTDRIAAIRQGDAALARLAGAPGAFEDPLLVVALSRMSAFATPIDPRPYLDWLAGRDLHYGRENALRYRWGLSWRAEPGHALYRAPSGAAGTHWRPAERDRLAANPSGYGRRLMEPVTLAAHFRYWGDVAAQQSDTETGALAAALLAEAQSTVEHDVASWFQAVDPWRDTFALWLLSGESQAVSRVRDLLFSIAIRYGGIASRDGVVRGIRHPFYDRPLVSASAHLAMGLWRMGVYPTVIPGLMDLLKSSASREGSWADGDQPPDVLTTLAVANVLSRLDPTYDPAATVDWFVRRQERDGWWRALGPEVPWLTAAVMDWLELAVQPFAERFTWPSAPVWARDRLTGLTTVATLDELASVFEGLAPLAAQRVEGAFLDLAGFGNWNTAHGQSRGDDLLGVLGSTLLDLPGVLPVRVGGDEFIILAKPGGSGLRATLDSWRATWPAQLDAANMPAAVAPRIVLSAARARDLRSLRQFLGDQIGQLKHDVPSPPAEGVVVEVVQHP
jgi:GGDEF domain-containing protein